MRLAGGAVGTEAESMSREGDLIKYLVVLG